MSGVVFQRRKWRFPPPDLLETFTHLVRVGLELRFGLVRVRIRVRIRFGLDLGLGLA